MSESEAEAAADEESARLTELGRQDRNALRAFIDEWWVSAEQEFFDIITDKLRSDGGTDDEISDKLSKITSLLDKKDGEDRKELVAELIEGYYESLLEPEEGEEFWEEFFEELLENDD